MCVCNMKEPASPPMGFRDLLRNETLPDIRYIKGNCGRLSVRVLKALNVYGDFTKRRHFYQITSILAIVNSAAKST